MTNPFIEKTVGDVITAKDIEGAMVELSEDKLTKAQAHQALKAFKDVINLAVSSGAKIQIPGFLTFTSVYKPERSGTNTFTNEPFTAPEKAVLHIKPGTSLKESALSITGETLQQLKALKK